MPVESTLAMDQSKLVELLQRGVSLHQAGDLRAAEVCYRQALEVHRDHPDALHLLGVIARQSGRTDVAIDLMARAIAVNPNFAEWHLELADLQHEVGEYERAIEGYRAALRLRADYVEALNNLGNALRKVGRLDEAMEALGAAIRLRPELPQPHNNVAIVLKNLGQLEEAQAQCREAIRLNPNYSEAYINLGNICYERREVEEAVAAFAKAVQFDPQSAPAHNNLGTGLELKGDLDGAEREYRAAIQIEPSFASPHGNLGNVHRQQARHEEAMAELGRAIELEPTNQTHHSNLLYSMHFHPGQTGERILDAHLKWARAFADPLTAVTSHQRDHNADTLRVGFVSADIYQHAVGRFLMPLLEARDRERMKVVCYSGVVFADELTERAKGLCDEWRTTVGVPDETLAEMIRRDEIDLLVDLSLHSAGNRLMVFARKPAPVQITYLGYPGTSGMRAMDYRLTDAFLDPARNERFYSEKSLRVQSYWCYQAPVGAPEVGSLPAERNGFITFGCLNNSSKQNERVWQVWARILERVPKARLVLHAGEGSHRKRVPIDPARVTFVGKVTFGEYLAAYNGIDVALDPFPYTGGTTTCDALWMGVPVVTLAGLTAVQRGGVSLLNNAGLPELVAGNVEEYVERAVELANDVDRLISLRRGLRERMRASRLMNAVSCARDFEAACRAAWRAL